MQSKQPDPRNAKEDLALFESALDSWNESDDADDKNSPSSKRLEVDEDNEGERLDAWMARAMSISRAQVQRLLSEDRVHYLGPRQLARLKPSIHLESGDLFSVEPLEVEPLDVEPENIPLDIVYEDSHLLVLVKPRGMVVHPATGVNRGTLVNALLAHCRDLSGIGGVGRPGIVHRLDKDTSGLMVVAKNDATHTELSRQFAVRAIEKEYLALVHGQTAASSTIDMPIGRHPMDRKRMAVVFSGRNAVTEYERVEELEDFSLLRVRLHTGRTHQIRVHLAWLGHPLAGDPVYCRRDPLNLKGQFLHAARLGFTHPVSGEKLEFEAPLPDDLAHALVRLRQAVRRSHDDNKTKNNSLRILDGWREAASGV